MAEHSIKELLLLGIEVLELHMDDEVKEKTIEEVGEIGDCEDKVFLKKYIELHRFMCGTEFHVY